MRQRIKSVYEYRDMIFSLVHRELSEIGFGNVVDLFESVMPNSSLYVCIYKNFPK